MADLRPIEPPTPDEVAAMREGVEARLAEIRAEDERKRFRELQRVREQEGA